MPVTDIETVGQREPQIWRGSISTAAILWSSARDFLAPEKRRVRVYLGRPTFIMDKAKSESTLPRGSSQTCNDRVFNTAATDATFDASYGNGQTLEKKGLKFCPLPPDANEPFPDVLPPVRCGLDQSSAYSLLATHPLPGYRR